MSSLSPDAIESAIQQALGARAGAVIAQAASPSEASQAKARAALYSNRPVDGDLGDEVRRSMRTLSDPNSTEEQQMRAAILLSEAMNVMRSSDARAVGFQ